MCVCVCVCFFSFFPGISLLSQKAYHREEVAIHTRLNSHCQTYLEQPLTSSRKSLWLCSYPVEILSAVFVAGTMTGGGGRVMKGRMSCKLHADVSPDQLAEMEGRLGTNERALQVRSRTRE